MSDTRPAPWPDLTSRIRGLLTGLVLGDALARSPWPVPTEGHLVGGAGGSLALATTEGLIRGLVREAGKGISGGVPGCVWHATLRWAEWSGLGDTPAVRSRRQGFAADARWPDGWLSQLATLRRQQGPAPALRAALARHKAPQPGDAPTSTSLGDLVVFRVLPLGLLRAVMAPEGRYPGRADEPLVGDLPDAVAGLYLSTVGETAAQTHGPAAQAAAVLAALLTGHTLCTGSVPRHLSTPTVRDALSRVHGPRLGDPGAVPAAAAVTAGLRHGAAADPTQALAAGPPRTAPRALAGGLALAAAHPARDELAVAVATAAAWREPGAAAVGLALLGASHGVEALPPALVDRLELAHIADQLGMDLATWIACHPFSEYDTSPEAAAWWDRYPGW